MHASAHHGADALVAAGPQPLGVCMQVLTTARPHFPTGTRSWPAALKQAKSWIPAAHPSASLLYLYDGQVIAVDCNGGPLTAPKLPLMASASLHYLHDGRHDGQTQNAMDASH